MLERMLSPRAFRIYIVLVVVGVGYFGWERLNDSGIVAMIDRMQAERSDDENYYPFLSIAILCVPVILVGWGVGILHDYVFTMGVFVPKELRQSAPKLAPRGTNYNAALNMRLPRPVFWRRIRLCVLSLAAPIVTLLAAITALFLLFPDRPPANALIVGLIGGLIPGFLLRLYFARRFVVDIGRNPAFMFLALLDVLGWILLFVLDDYSAHVRGAPLDPTTFD